MEQGMRRTGIEVIGGAPWGTHFCQFYESKQDLLEILVPYFRQGLGDNEFCMWVTSEPLQVSEARTALSAAVPDLGDSIRQGRIEILDYTEWYTRSGCFNAEQVLQGWIDKLEGALARGFEGLRLTGNTFWLESKDWAGFTAYEEAVNRVIGNYRMLAVCTYSLNRCGAHEIMDVLSNHRFALVKREGRWQMVESSGRRLAEAALAESEQKYSEADRAMRQLSQFPLQNPNPVLRVACDGTLLFANEPARKWLAALGWQTPQPLPAQLLTVAAQACKGEQPAETEVACQEGRTYFLTAAKPPHEDYVNCYAIDITQRKRTERQLQEVAEKYSTLFDTTSDGVWIHNLDGEILEINDAYCRMSGYSRDELRRMPVSKLEAVESPRETSDHLRKLIESGGHDRFESRHRRKDGSILDVDITALYFDRVLGRIAIFTRDITQRKKAEEALRESETRLRRFYESGLVGITYWKMNGAITDANDKFLQLVGYSRQELAAGQLDWLRLTPSEYRQRDEESMAELKATGFNKNSFEKEYIRKDGTRVPVLVSGAMLDEERLNGVAIVVDISKRKQAEEDLRQSREDLNRAQEVGQLGSWRLDVKRDVLSWSDETYRIFGVPKGTPQTYETFLNMVHPEDRQYVDTNWKAGLAGEPYDIEHRLFVDGQVKWVREKAFLEFDGAGELLGGFGIVQDITERKRIEEELERLAQQRQLALDAADLGWWHYDPVARVASWDEGCRKILGVADCQGPLEEMLARLHPADLPGVLANVDEALDPVRPTPFSAEYRLLLPDGSAKWAETHGLASFEGHGQDRQAVSLVGTVADITERRQAEQALKASYEELDRFNRAMVGREARMIELKKQVNELFQKAGQAAPYPLNFEK